MKNVTKKLLQYGICGVLGGLIALWVMDLEGFFVVWRDRAAATSILCNAFFVPGILLASFGALFWVANTGFFDSIAYAAHVVGHMFLPMGHAKRKTYYDYKTEKAEKRASVPIFIFIVGVFYLALSVICLGLWYAVS